MQGEKGVQKDKWKGCHTKFSKGYLGSFMQI
jgi:hypothetical protein